MLRIDLNAPAAFEIWRSDTVGAMFELAKRAPGATARLSIGDEEVLIFQDANAARQVLHTNGANYNKNFGGFESFFGASRLTSDGPRWEMLHRLSQPYITSARPERVVEVAAGSFAKAAQDLLEGVDRAGGLVVDRHVNRAAARVVIEVALGFHDLEVDDALMDTFRDVLNYGSLRTWNLSGGIQAEDEQMRIRFLRARDSLRQIMTDAAAKAIRDDAQGDTLLRALKQGEADGVDLVGEICSLLFAGFDTSGAAIAWGVFLLAVMPDLQALLRSKVREACGNSLPSVEQLNAISELAAFQNEVLRIFPPTPILGRVATGPDKVGDVAIGEGQRVVISIIGLHHDRSVFPAPASLRLARYPEGRMTREQMGHLLPFGAGRRVCGGSRMANAELTTAFAVLLQRLQFSVADDRPLRFEWNPTLRRRDGHYLLVREAA